MVESPGFNRFIRKIRPSYTPPSADTLGGSMLDKEYGKLSIQLKAKVEGTRFISVVTDGWYGAGMGGKRPRAAATFC